MKKVQDDQKTIEMLAAAVLAGEGRAHKDIKYLLGVSGSAVTRHLTKARKEFLREQVRFLSYKVPRATMEKVRRRLTQQPLQEKLEKLGRSQGRERAIRLRVFPCGGGGEDRERMKKLGEFAAPVVRQLLLRSRSCGLTWGGMLKAVVTGLRDLPFPPPWRKTPIQCIPLSGEPLARDRASFSSSSLARDLGIIINGDQYDAPSLAMVPAFIPDAFRKHEQEGVRNLIELVKSYHDIFGGQGNGNSDTQTAKPKAMTLDMILTSVGSLDKPLGFGRGVLFDEMSVSYQDLKSFLVAEVGGVCIPRPNLAADKKEQFHKVQNSWTGLRLEHLMACAARGGGALKGPPGVVVISGGKGKASAVCELIKLGLVNYLLIDEVLAEELDKES